MHTNINSSLDKFKIRGRAWLSKLKESVSTQYIYFPCGMKISSIGTARAIRKRKIINSNIFYILQLLNCHGKSIVFFIKYAFLDFFQMFFLFLFLQKPIKHC